MKSTIIKSILGLALLLSPAIETIASQNQKQNCKSETVYICTGPASKRYHKSKKCRGLRSCSTEITCVSKSKAEAQNYTPCKICY